MKSKSMDLEKNPYRTPYGAYELKRCYQKNLILGLISAILFVAVNWSLIAIFLGNGAQAGSVEIPRHESEFDLRPPPKLVLQPPRIHVGSKPRPKSGGKLVPVDVDEFIDDDELPNPVIPFENMTPGDFEPGSGEIGASVEPYSFPPSDTFIVVEVQPKLVKRVIPDYPTLAKNASMEGTVWVKILVDKQGKVRDVIIAKGSGSNIGFEEAAFAAAKLCEFSPAIQNGRPVAIWVTFPFEFRLN